MHIKVRSFAGFRHILGREQLVELPDGALVQDLLRALCQMHEQLGPLIFEGGGIKEDVNVFVNGRNMVSLQGAETRLGDGDEVALFPAAIGG